MRIGRLPKVMAMIPVLAGAVSTIFFLGQGGFGRGQV